MALLIDEILRRGIRTNTCFSSDGGETPAPDKVRGFGEMYEAQLHDLRGKSVVRASNIQQWLQQTYGEDNYNPEDLECCFAPFPQMWVEWTAGAIPHRLAPRDGRIGCLVHSSKNERIEPIGGWITAVLPAFLTERGVAISSHCTFNLLDDNGNWERVCLLDFEGNHLALNEAAPDEREFYFKMTFVVLQTFSFMNCQGVRETVEHPSSTPLQKKWNQKAKKDGKQPLPLVSFTTVDIGPVIARGKKDAKSEPTGRHNREHWTRGHVKHYPGLLLFGRIQLDKPGIWCPAFKSGRAKGEVKRAKYDVTIPERSIDLGHGAAAA